MTLTPAWRECLITSAVALLLWLGLALSGGGGSDGERPRLIGTAADEIAVRFDDTAFRLDLDPDAPRVLDAEGALLGRAWPRESRAIASAIAETRVLRRIRPEDGAWAEYGFDHPVTLEMDGRRWSLASAGIDRGYVRDGEHLLILDTDLAALLRRPPAALRHPSLDISGCIRLAHDRGWSLAFAQGRWWLRRDDGDDREWTDRELCDAYLRELTAAPVVGYLDETEAERVRAVLTVERDRERGPVRIEDLGPARGGERVLRRSEAGIEELLVVDVDPLLLDPEPSKLRSPKLVPLDPLTAERVRIGRVDLRRDGEHWRMGPHRDLDPSRIDRLLRRLGAMPRRDDVPQGGKALVTVESEGLRFELTHEDPRIVAVVQQLRPHHLRQRALLGDVDASEVDAVIIQPAEGAPDIYSRDDSGAWPADSRAAVESFVQSLTTARVAEWTGASDHAETDYDSTIALSVGSRNFTLHLRADGRVAVVERNLTGILDETSRREVLAE